MMRSLLAALSPAGFRGRLSILIFHRVLARPDPLFPLEMVTETFDQVIGWTKAMFNVLPLPEAVERLREGSLPARAASITFDDGYADNYLHALPILQRHEVTATFFVATGFLDGGRMWNDTLIEAIRATPHESIDLSALGLGTVAAAGVDQKRRAVQMLIGGLKHLKPPERDQAVETVAELCDAELPNELMLTTGQLRALHAAGMTIGAHTVSHPILAQCDAAGARREIEESRSRLESLLGERITLFAYPNGKPGKDYGPAHVRMVAELGFDAAVSTKAGASRHGDDPFQLRRFTPWDRQRWRFGFHMAMNLRHDRLYRLRPQ
jgi:peptidoglycan/xylan/chitin deacetylase (PgdA/CDA1 family)